VASSACLDHAHALSACLNNASGIPAPDLHDTGRIVHTSLRDRRVIATTDLPDGRVVIDAVLLRLARIERAVLQDADRAIDSVLTCGSSIAATILSDLGARRRPSGVGLTGQQRRIAALRLRRRCAKRANEREPRKPATKGGHRQYPFTPMRFQ